MFFLKKMLDSANIVGLFRALAKSWQRLSWSSVLGEKVGGLGEGWDSGSEALLYCW